MKRLFKKKQVLCTEMAFVKDERGIVTTETIIMIAVVAIVAVTVFQIMNTLLPSLFREVIERITQMVTGRIIP